MPRHALSCSLPPFFWTAPSLWGSWLGAGQPVRREVPSERMIGDTPGVDYRILIRFRLQILKYKKRQRDDRERDLRLFWLVGQSYTPSFDVFSLFSRGGLHAPRQDEDNYAKGLVCGVLDTLEAHSWKTSSVFESGRRSWSAGLPTQTGVPREKSPPFKSSPQRMLLDDSPPSSIFVWSPSSAPASSSGMYSARIVSPRLASGAACVGAKDKERPKQ